MNNILIIGKHWLEPNSSAAGTRMMQLIELLLPVGSITFASAAAETDFSVDFPGSNVAKQHIVLNDTSFNDFLRALNPAVVLFDRFMTEEQFGWRVAEVCPDALRILDTEDLHGLRQARETALKQQREFSEKDLVNETSLRELASIYRCDLALIISQTEMKLLQEFFRVPAELLHYLPFLVRTTSIQKNDFPAFEHRRDFATIGNFLHGPNKDAVYFLKKEIWPLIHAELPDAHMHVYGAYAPEALLKLSDEKVHFHVHGRAENADEVVQSARVFLAPLRYGAGLKGKLLLSMQCATPSVTTSIGAEGMHENDKWNGAITDRPKGFADAAVDLYTSPEKWQTSVANGFQILSSVFEWELHDEVFTNRWKTIQEDLAEHRLRNFTGQILQHQTMRSTKYMSKWIEEKNKYRRDSN